MVILTGALCAAYWYARRRPFPEAEGAEGKEPPVARVRVVPLKEDTVNVTVIAYGTVKAAPGSTRTFSVPFESRVTRMPVASGQMVRARDALVELESSPDVLLKLDQARQERDAARKLVDLARQRLELKLATRQEVLPAEQALAAAELNLNNMTGRGIDGRQTIRAGAPGIVSGVNVQEGQIVPAGTTLVETIEERHISVQLGVESGDAVHLHAGQEVRIEPVNRPSGVFSGRILRISREVDQKSRLVNIYVAPAAGSRLLLNEYVRGRIMIASRSGLVIPVEAVALEEDSHALYTVEGGRAVKHIVEIGAESDGRILVLGKDLREGQKVVTVGNSQLGDGMAVRVEKGS